MTMRSLRFLPKPFVVVRYRRQLSREGQLSCLMRRRVGSLSRGESGWLRMLKSLYDTTGRSTEDVSACVSAQRRNSTIADDVVFSTNAGGGLKTWPTDRDDHACATHRGRDPEARQHFAVVRRREG